MSDLKKMKNEYESIEASKEFKANILKKSKAKRRFSVIEKTLSAVAAFLLISTVALNVSPAFAKSISEIPGLKGVVNVLTASRYEFKDNGYEANVVVPKIEGLLDKELEEKLNNDFKENANSVISAFEKDVKKLKAEFGDETVHYGIDCNYEIKTDNENILAIDVYIYSVSGSSFTKHSFYTINKKTGELLTLEGLFKDKSYIEKISGYIKEEMLRRNNEENGLFWINSDFPENDFKEIKSDQNFYINNEGNLVICYDKYEVAAGAQGSPEFIIPNELINDILIPNKF